MSTTTVNINANQVKELREKTGAPMMDCKQALTEAKGDMEQAVVLLRKEDVTTEAYEREKDIYRAQAAQTGKPPQVVEKIVEGKMSKFYEEVCLYEQPFIKDQTVSISQLIATKIGKLSENISVRRFARFKVGEAGATIAFTKTNPDEGGEAA